MQTDMLRQLRYDECDGGRPNLLVYDDATGHPIGPGSRVVGHPTIGIGRALDTHGIAASEAESMFASDVAFTEAGIIAAQPWVAGLDDVRRAVLVNMGFQLGLGGVLAFRHMLAALEAADYPAAAAAALNSAWAQEMAAFGSSRARRLAAQLVSGDPATPAPAPAQMGA